jgi:predicted N-acetyltransferase YhbS
MFLMGTNGLEIRAEESDDHEAISALITAAFLEAEHRDGNEAAIVEALRSDGALAISLVACDGPQLVGHAAFSEVALDREHCGWFGVEPVAVLPAHQRRGIGKALIDAGLAMLRTRGARGCVVLGDPDYYRRFGFTADPRLMLAGVPPAYFQYLAFAPHQPAGIVEFHAAFRAR